MIHRVPYLQVCERCKVHAQVVLPDGNASRVFTTKSAGHAQVSELLAKGQIGNIEAVVLRELIGATNFPEKDELYSDVEDLINSVHDELLWGDLSSSSHTIH